MQNLVIRHLYVEWILQRSVKYIVAPENKIEISVQQEYQNPSMTL